MPDERAKELFVATQGYPFLLSLVIEETGAPGGGSALFLRRFFERTTRWMTATEIEWFVRVCYLERVNLDTLARLFPQEQCAVIQTWFEKEPSIRDPLAAESIGREPHGRRAASPDDAVEIEAAAEQRSRDEIHHRKPQYPEAWRWAFCRSGDIGVPIFVPPGVGGTVKETHHDAFEFSDPHFRSGRVFGVGRRQHRDSLRHVVPRRKAGSRPALSSE